MMQLTGEKHQFIIACLFPYQSVMNEVFSDLAVRRYVNGGIVRHRYLEIARKDISRHARYLDPNAVKFDEAAHYRGTFRGA